LEELFPGYGEELVAAGGVSIGGRRDFYMYSQGNYLAAGSNPFPLYAATRPLYEQLLRRRVSDQGDIHLQGSAPFVAYLADDATTIVKKPGWQLLLT
jgi:hypothetical protein